MKSNANWVADHGVSDWVKNDKRSVAAMLNGNGDERVAAYEDFCKFIKAKTPNINPRHIDLKYSEFISKKEMEIGPRQIRKVDEPDNGSQVDTFVSCVLAMMVIYWAFRAFS